MMIMLLISNRQSICVSIPDWLFCNNGFLTNPKDRGWQREGIWCLVLFHIAVNHLQPNRAVSTKLIRVTHIHYFLQSKQALHLFYFLSMYNSFSNLLTRGVFCSCCKWIIYFCKEHVHCLSKTYGFASKLLWIEDKICLFWWRTCNF